VIDLNNVPNKPPPPSKPPKTSPPPTKPKGKDRSAGLMHDVQWPGDICPKKLLVAALLTAKALFVHWRELPALWRETEAYR